MPCLALSSGTLSGNLSSAVANDVTERLKSFVYRVRIGKDFGNVRIKDYHDRVL